MLFTEIYKNGRFFTDMLVLKPKLQVTLGVD